MNRIYSLDTYKMIDRERIYAALDQGNRHDASISLKYSSLTRQEFADILHHHPSFNQKEGFEDEAWRQLLDVISTNNVEYIWIVFSLPITLPGVAQ